MDLDNGLIDLVHGLVDQQAMPDGWWKPQLDELLAEIESARRLLRFALFNHGKGRHEAVATLVRNALRALGEEPEL